MDGWTDGCSQQRMCETSQHVRQVRQIYKQVRIVLVGRDVSTSYEKAKYAINIREKNKNII